MWAFIVCSLNIVTYLQLKSKNKEQKAALDMSDNRFENLIQAFNTLIQTHIEVTSAHEVVKKELKAMKENHG
jgi:DNA-binding SARP family transcriptional activator